MTEIERDALLKVLKEIPVEEKGEPLGLGTLIEKDDIYEYQTKERFLQGNVGNGHFYIRDRYSTKPINKDYPRLTHFYTFEVTQWSLKGERTQSLRFELEPNAIKYSDEELLTIIKHLYSDIIQAGGWDIYKEDKE